MRITPTQNNFSGGEWSPSLYGRSDLSKYSAACKTVKNWLVHAHGGATTRPGTYFIGELPNGNHGKGRLIPFQFSATDNCVLVFSYHNLSVIRGEAFIADGTLPLATSFMPNDLAAFKYSQTADTMYITSHKYPPQRLTRKPGNEWTLEPVVFGTSQLPPTNLTRSVGTGTDHGYCVTAVSDTGEESIASNVVQAKHDDTLSWEAPTGTAPSHYSVYKDTGNTTGIYGWVSDVKGTSWKVQAINPDLMATPPEAFDFLTEMGNPASCCFFEQRMVYAGFPLYPGTIVGSRIGFYNNFNKSFSTTDDESYEFTLDSNQLNYILWLLPLERLLIGTAGSEWRMDGGASSDTITPTSVNVRVQSQWGSADLMPIVAGDTILYVQYGAKKIRELAYSLESDRYVGRDLTVLSTHLFDDRRIVDWCHQRTPDSIVWCVMSDGTLLGLTYLKEQEVWAWHRHETDGIIENCCIIPDDEGGELLYLIVRRTVGGVDKRYVESVQPIDQSKPERAWHLDCARQYDVPITIVSFAAQTKQFGAPGHGLETGDHIKLYDLGGPLEAIECVPLRVTRVDDDHFTVEHTIGTGWGAFTQEEWDAMGVADYAGKGTVRKLVTTISGLGHLEGRTVTALADGSVICDLKVTSGKVTLPVESGLVTVGLPYVCDLQPLDPTPANQTQTAGDKPRRIVSAAVRLHASRSLQIGPDTRGLIDVPFRTTEPLGKPIGYFSGVKTINLRPSSGREGGLLLRVAEPLPTSVLSIISRIDVGGE